MVELARIRALIAGLKDFGPLLTEDEVSKIEDALNEGIDRLIKMTEE